MGKAKDKHRGFFVSADLVDFPESTDKTPWQAKAANGGKLEALSTFVCEQKGPFDVSLAFDGASKSARRGGGSKIYCLEDLYRNSFNMNVALL